MKMNTVVDVLNANGIKAELSTANKNGKEIPCVRFGEGRVTPTAYEATFDQFETEEEVVDFAKKALANTPEFNMDEIFSKEYVLAHVVSCVRHETDDEKICKFPVMGDLEEYFRIPVEVDEGCNGSIVVLKEHLKSLGIDADELRTVARDNLRTQAVIQPMREVLAQMMGKSIDDIPDMGDNFMYIGSVESRSFGAAVLLLRSVLSDFCHQKGIRSLKIIPASVNEILLISDEIDDSIVNEMISDVNATQFSDESEILSGHCYHFVA